MSRPVSYLPRVWIGSKLSAKLLPPSIHPLAAHIKLTENCQARCISCDYWKTRWQDAISTERAIELLNECGDLGVRSLRFTGGEPLLRKDFFEILAAAKTSAFKHIIIQTNGLLIKKLHKEINASPITDVAVSIDGLKEKSEVVIFVESPNFAFSASITCRDFSDSFRVHSSAVSARAVTINDNVIISGLADESPCPVTSIVLGEELIPCASDAESKLTSAGIANNAANSIRLMM